MGIRTLQLVFGVQIVYKRIREREKYFFSPKKGKIMKARKLFLVGILIIIIAVSSGCTKQSGRKNSKQTGITSDGKMIDSNKETDTQSKNNGNSILPEIEANPAEKEWIFSMGDHVEMNDVQSENIKLDFCVEEAVLTKSYCGKEGYAGQTKELVEFSADVKVDESGNLLSDHLYLWLNVKVKNISNKLANIVFGSYSIGVIDEKNYLHALDKATEPVYMNKIIDVNNTDKEAAFEKLQGGEEKEYQIAYLLEKKDIDSNLIYYISDTVMESPSETSYIIRLDRVVKK